MIMSEVFKITEEELKTIKKILDMISGNAVEQQPKTWPQDGGECWKILGNGKAKKIIFNPKFHESYLDLGFLFRSLEDAHKFIKQKKAETKVIRRLRELEPEGWKPVFNGFISNHRCAYDHVKNELYVDCSLDYQGCKSSWYTTEEAAKQVVQEMPEAIKTMLGVE